MAVIVHNMIYMMELIQLEGSLDNTVWHTVRACAVRRSAVAGRGPDDTGHASVTAQIIRRLWNNVEKIVVRYYVFS